MYSSRPYLFGVVFAVLVCSARAQNTAELPMGTYRVQRVEIVDPSGFGQPMAAASLLIPAGWTAEGGIVWQQGQNSCGKASTRFEWRATSPDGASAIELLPEEAWSGNNLGLPQTGMPCPNVTITNVKDYLQWYAGRVRPGARILDYRDRSDAIEQPGLYNRNDRTAYGELRMWAECGEVLLAYQHRGHEVRESLGVMVIFSLNRMSGVMPGEIREFLSISAQVGYAVRFPRGKLDFKFAELMRRSLKVDPRWSALMAEHTQKMTGISAKGAADRHAIRMKTAQEIAEINRQGYESRQASGDRTQQQFTQTIRGVETYVDPTTNQRTELPNNYNHAWRLNDGTFILTNDSQFQPNRDLGVEGQQLEAAK